MKRTLAVLAAALVALTGCSSSLQKYSSPTFTPAAPSSSAPGASASPSTPWSSSTALARRTLTTGDLKPALMTLDDAPVGFSDETDTLKDPAGQVTFASTDPKCTSLVGLLNAQKYPGTVAQVTVVLSGGQQGPVITEYLDAMGTEVAAGEVVTRHRNAIKSCGTVTAQLVRGKPPARVTVREVTAPPYGTAPFAFRMTTDPASSTPWEVTGVLTRNRDVLVTLQLAAAYPEDIDDAAYAATDKLDSNFPTARSAS